MRAASYLPLAFTAAVLAGCAAESHQVSNEETASRAAEGTVRSERDLTLQTPATPAVEVASPVELSRPAPEPAKRRRVSPKPAPVRAPEPAPAASPAAQAAIPIPSVAPAHVLTEPSPAKDLGAGAGRELAPGKTVTIIPASSGPSISPEDHDRGPAAGRGTIIRGKGGTCRPRGGVRGIGIAGRIPIGVPGRRVR
jgi:hypothetical protein